MSSAALDALARRCEAASGPDRLLDCDIHDALGLSKYRKERPYTASLDAAMSLVHPEWGDWSLSRDSLHKFEAAVWACPSRYTAHGAAAICHQGYHETSPALALCAAALDAMKERQP